MLLSSRDWRAQISTMEYANQIIFVVSLLLVMGILAGRLSSRVGAPLLLAFLGLGVLAGPQGLGIVVHDRNSAYLVGSVAVALILFDGGLHTRRSVFRMAVGPAGTLATLGVLVTAGIAGLGAVFVMHLPWLQGALIGSIVASTDAAAVMLLLHQSGRNVNMRLSATLETEAALNDPMAVFLTVACVAALTGPAHTAAGLGVFLLRQAALGIGIGLAGGAGLVTLVNRLNISAGVYPILVMVGALTLFGGTQLLDGSGYLAIYLAGLVCGNMRLRLSQGILRFHEAIAWLSQLVLFILLGLLVVPSRLVPDAPAAVAIALLLILVARPVAVWLCLLPFRFSRQEKLFVAWVGLRGAVPVFLAMIPGTVGLAHSDVYFHVTFIVVVASLILQGWTIPTAARWLNLDLPAMAPEAERLDLQVAAEDAREFAAWRVAAGSLAAERPLQELRLPGSARLVTILRDGIAVDRTEIDRLRVGDVVLALAPDETIAAADRLFAAQTSGRPDAPTLGEFSLDPEAPMTAVVELYGLPNTLADRAESVGALLKHRLGQAPVVGDRIHLGAIDLIVQAMDGNRISAIGVALEPPHSPFEDWSLRASLGRLVAPLRRKR